MKMKIERTKGQFSLIHDKQRFRSTEEWFTPKEVFEGLGEAKQKAEKIYNGWLNNIAEVEGTGNNI